MDRTEGPERPYRQSAEATAGRAAQEGAQHGAHVVREKGQDVAGTARQGAEQVLRETADRGRDVYERFREQVSDEAGAQVRRLSAHVRHLAEELRHMSESAKPESSAASLVHRVSEHGQQLADRLDRQGPGELLDDVRDLARRRPGVFLAGAALAGFAVSRLGRGVTAAGGTDAGADYEERAAQAPPLPPSAREQLPPSAADEQRQHLSAEEQRQPPFARGPQQPSFTRGPQPPSAYEPQPGLHGGEGPAPPARHPEAGPGQPGRGW
ncbi:hypothetical protein GCM10010129_37750 [Streptomyces fumigatiscleroticus]|nr:hypothetical protein GCM10010129_37750 [Streptomyces fumigatiscleroticus]